LPQNTDFWWNKPFSPLPSAAADSACVIFDNSRFQGVFQRHRRQQERSFETIWPGVACVEVAVSTFYQRQINVMPPDFQNREEPPIVACFVFWVNP